MFKYAKLLTGILSVAKIAHTVVLYVTFNAFLNEIHYCSVWMKNYTIIIVQQIENCEKDWIFFTFLS